MITWTNQEMEAEHAWWLSLCNAWQEDRAVFAQEQSWEDMVERVEVCPEWFEGKDAVLIMLSEIFISKCFGPMQFKKFLLLMKELKLFGLCLYLTQERSDKQALHLQLCDL